MARLCQERNSSFTSDPFSVQAALALPI